jgi:hypothetical protein
MANSFGSRLGGGRLVDPAIGACGKGFLAAWGRHLHGRGLAKLKKGNIANGNADIAAAETLNQNIAEEYVRYGAQ